MNIIDLKESKYNNAIPTLHYPIGDNILIDLPIIDKLIKALLEYGKEDLENNNTINLIGKGSSGSILCTIFMLHLKEVYKEKIINIVYIKKPGENSHSNYISPSVLSSGLNIFIDDFMATGSTLRASHNKMINITHEVNFLFDYIVMQSIWECDILLHPVGKTIISHIIYHDNL